MSRAQSAAATRQALLHEAAELLDSGGPEAVTLREVGARAGVTRGAPYGHFDNKGSLLTAVAVTGWDRITEQMHTLRTESMLASTDKLREAITVIITLSRRQPYLYQLMFTPPTSDPATVAEAAQRLCDEFHEIVSDVVGCQDAQRYAAVLLTGAHGAAGLESSGLLSTDRWQTSAEDLTEIFVALLPERVRPE